ncbi:MAG: YncE family protein [Chloroflexi bacterium OHK40]
MKRIVIFVLIGILLLGGAAILFARGGSGTASVHEGMVRGTVWVANEEGNSLTAIDAATQRVVTTLTGVAGPHNIQVAPDGRSVWAISGHDNQAIAIDTSTYKLLGTAPTGHHPAHIILSPDGRTAYVTNAEDNTVSAIDTANFQTKATITVGDYPHGLRPSPDGRWVYVANMQDTTVSVIDTTSNQRVADIEVGLSPVQVAFSPDGATAYVSLNAENAVGRIDVAGRTLTGKVQVGVGPVQVFVSPNNETLLVANQGTPEQPSTTVSFVETAGLSVVKTVETGQGAHGVTIDPTGRHAYVTNIYGDDLAVLDLAERRVVATLPMGAAPNGVSFTPNAPASAGTTEIALLVPSQTDIDAHGEESTHGEEDAHTDQP